MHDLAVAAGPKIELLHQTRMRLRVRYAAGIDGAALRARLDQMAGVTRVRLAPAIRSLTVEHDGRIATRDALLRMIRQRQQATEKIRPSTTRASGARSRHSKPAGPATPLAPALVAATIPAFPAAIRPWLALAAVAGRAVLSKTLRTEPMALALDSVSLATTALTGHPLASATSVILGALSERWSQRLLADTDELLERIAPVENPLYAVKRGGKALELAPQDLEVHDLVYLRDGWTTPIDGVVSEGRATLMQHMQSGHSPQRLVSAGSRIFAGESIESGKIALLVEQLASRSRGARLREHIRHAVHSRDQPGRLSPNIERLIALPITSAALVVALTGDVARAAAMLQADPQQGLALAQPVAREASLYALARKGVLMSGMEAIERLASATTIAVEDVGILTESAWRVETIESHERSIDEGRVRQWLARLAGSDAAVSNRLTFPDHRVAAWREHGAVLRDGKRFLHFCGSALAMRTWDIELPQPDRRSLMRRIAIICDGALQAIVQLVSPLRSDLVGQFERLRALGVARLAIFTEDPAAQPAHVLTRLGADEIVCADRNSQADWLSDAAMRGERVALVHTGMRNLLPPGGLSLCPIDAEAGAHGALLGNPLESLIAGRQVAQQVQRRLHRHYASSVIVNGVLMGGSALALWPPIITAGLHHGFAFVLLQDSLRLAEA